MRIKRFTAPDMRTALRMVRDEQGPDAVILSTRPGAGGAGIEVVAATDYDEALVAQALRAAAPAAEEAPARPAANAQPAANAVADGAPRESLMSRARAVFRIGDAPAPATRAAEDPTLAELTSQARRRPASPAAARPQAAQPAGTRSRMPASGATPASSEAPDAPASPARDHAAASAPMPAAAPASPAAATAAAAAPAPSPSRFDEMMAALDGRAGERGGTRAAGEAEDFVPLLPDIPMPLRPGADEAAPVAPLAPTPAAAAFDPMPAQALAALAVPAAQAAPAAHAAYAAPEDLPGMAAPVVLAAPAASAPSAAPKAAAAPAVPTSPAISAAPATRVIQAAPAPCVAPVAPIAAAAPTPPAAQTGADAILPAAPAAASEPVLADAAVPAQAQPTAPRSLQVVATAETDPAILAMREEMARMRQLMETQMEQLSLERLRGSPARAAVLDALPAYGCEESLAQAVAERIDPRLPVDRIQVPMLAELANMLGTLHSEPLEDGGVIALVGPTGAGKTTTAAKLASRFAARHRARDVALVTTDCQRPGAREQLQAHGRRLGITVCEAEGPERLQDTLAQLVDYPLVLVDTAGHAVRDRAVFSQILWLRAAKRVRSLLVLPANAHPHDLGEVIRRYRPAKPEGVVLTKLDETGRLGSALSVLARHGLGLAYTTQGQEVPSDLEAADATRLVQSLEKSRRAADNPLATEDHHAVA